MKDGNRSLCVSLINRDTFISHDQRQSIAHIPIGGNTSIINTGNKHTARTRLRAKWIQNNHRCGNKKNTGARKRENWITHRRCGNFATRRPNSAHCHRKQSKPQSRDANATKKNTHNTVTVTDAYAPNKGAIRHEQREHWIQVEPTLKQYPTRKILIWCAHANGKLGQPETINKQKRKIIAPLTKGAKRKNEMGPH